MNLYQIQDDDVSLFVLAANMQEAVERWRTVLIKAEKPTGDDDVDSATLKELETTEPAGVVRIAEDHEIVLPDFDCVFGKHINVPRKSAGLGGTDI